MDRLRAVAAKIIADYKEHYDFPPQGESHMEDCIMGALESVRSGALEEAAKVCDLYALAERSADDTSAGMWNAGPYVKCALAIRALSPARVAEEKDAVGKLTREQIEQVARMWRDYPLVKAICEFALLNFDDGETIPNVSGVEIYGFEREKPSAPESPAKEQPGEQNVFYIDFLCTNYPSCGCKTHTKEDCRLMPPPPERP